MTEDTQTPNPQSGADLLEPPSGGRVHFGQLTIYAKKVQLQAGAEGYQIEGLTDFNGLPVQFKGKVPDENSRTVHVVPVLTKQDRDGKDFTVHQNLLSGNLEYKRTLLPSLKNTVPNYASIVNSGAVVFVKIEEIPLVDVYPAGTDDNKLYYVDQEGERRDRTIWKVAEHYASPDAMKAASDEFFAQFREGDGEGGSASGGGLPEAPGSYNVSGWAGMTASIKEQFEQTGDAVKVATDYAFLDDIKTAANNGHSAPDIANAWGLPIPLVAQVVGS